MASDHVTPQISRDPSVENLPDFDGAEQHLCQICTERFQQPRVLQCLHVFCTACIDKLAENLTDLLTIACPTCKQETRVSSITDLPLDVVMINILDMVDIRKMEIVCTSCKAQEKAVARCSNCSSFLCPNCVTAHKYMRCFENHKVFINASPFKLLSLYLVLIFRHICKIILYLRACPFLCENDVCRF